MGINILGQELIGRDSFDCVREIIITHETELVWLLFRRHLRLGRTFAARLLTMVLGPQVVILGGDFCSVCNARFKKVAGKSI